MLEPSVSEAEVVIEQFGVQQRSMHQSEGGTSEKDSNEKFSHFLLHGQPI